MDINTCLADILRGLMAEQGKTILRLSASTGIPYATLHRRLNGKTPFTTNELAAIATELGTSVSALFAQIEAVLAA